MQNIGGLEPGDHVGAYRLVRELGAGGMASVWLAERADGRYKRAVALKLPHVAWTGELAARLARERDILAALEHPNIARLYEAGITEQGRPYLAMEYVDGLTIDQFCREKRLTTRQRVALMLQVAAAVAHAHARLIVHRDLKPTNILVSSDGSAHLLDFGIAKLLEGDGANASRMTQFAGRALTVDYASPEQIKGEPTSTASDVYSLAVVAYELLAEAYPYRIKRPGGVELERAITQIDPLPASEAAQDALRSRQLRGDLDAILNKAMKKDPRERYATVDAFAQDLERHLSGVPVHARPDTLTYRVRKFAARNRGGVVAGALVLAAVIAGTALALWQAHQADIQARLAQQAAASAEQQASRAEQVKRFVLSIFEDADFDAGTNTKTTAVDLLHRAESRINAELGNDPAVAVELLTSVGYSLIGLEQVEPALAVLKRAVALGEQKLGKTHRLTVAARVTLGEGLVDANEFDEAERVLAAARAGAEQIDSPREWADALRWTAQMRSQQGREEEALKLSEQAVRLGEARLGPEHKQLMMELYINQYDRWHAVGRLDSVTPARNAYRLAAELDRGQPSMSALVAREVYSAALADAGDMAAAVRECRQTADQMIALSGRNSYRTAIVLQTLGNLQTFGGELTDAIRSYQESLASLQASAMSRSVQTVASLRARQGLALLAARRLADAAPQFRESTRLFTAALGAKTEPTVITRAFHAITLARLGRLSEAETELSNLRSTASTGTVDYALFQARLAAVRNLQGRFEEASHLFDEALDTLGDGSRIAQQEFHRALALNGAGEAALETGRFDHAIEVLERGRKRWARLQAHGSPDAADNLVLLGRALLAAGRKADALRATAEAATFWDRFDSANRYAGIAYAWQARAAAAAGNAVLAAESLAKAKRVLRDSAFAADRRLLEN